ncbi:dual specificity tyrosine-phosphorylation-regulated kinase 1A-like isoform X1 [Schistocerca gregaria]|uniref:dual specificity tyrosine-phosphorylation-regulated kinase 1A-like isoform X1 n=1 Tax=Schistocerca gregaria TaxID=7010 RepID=UPI00211F0DEF|nr:dual specificity tyrosine-phosphorylation-regulated kinase 1A-like isoform X1 [Schistocerca gregaria]
MYAHFAAYNVTAATATLALADSGEHHNAHLEHHRHHHHRHHHLHSDDTVPVDHRQRVDKVPRIIHIIPAEHSSYEDTLPPYHKSPSYAVPNVKDETPSDTSNDCAQELKQPCPEACSLLFEPVLAECDDGEEVKFPNCCALHMANCKKHKNCTLSDKKEILPALNQY